MKKLIILFSLSFVLNCFAQYENNNKENREKFILNPWENINGTRYAVGYFNNLELEASYLLTSYPKTEQGYGGMGLRIQYLGAGLEYIRMQNKNIIGAKLSYENSIMFFSGQISADYLYGGNTQQIRIMPKIGLSIFGLITLYYGRNLHLISDSEILTDKHIISLQLNFLKNK